MKHSEEVKKKISESLKGHRVSEATREKISRTLKSKPILKDESIIGLKNGHLTIIEEVDRRVKPCGQKERMVICKCDCGNYTIVRLQSFMKGRVKSCGCMTSEYQRMSSTRHGMYKEKLYNIYRGIKNRCYNKKGDDYKDYGGRGIVMCDEWRSDFVAFYNWAKSNGYDESKPAKYQSIDRINVNGNYEPSNCRFVNSSMQSRNKRSTKRYLYKGRMLDLKTISEMANVDYYKLWIRINRRGDTLEAALSRLCEKKVTH